MSSEDYFAEHKDGISGRMLQAYNLKMKREVDNDLIFLSLVAEEIDANCLPG